MSEGATTILLLDVGSTFTKALAYRASDLKRLSAAQAESTPEEDIMIGVRQAVGKLRLPGAVRTPCMDDFAVRLASSSAAGGLRMVVCGLTPGLTERAGSEAAAGAGARIYGHFSGSLTAEDLANIRKLRPDILLFTGGTDGGESARVRENARQLAETDLQCAVVVACNARVADEVVERFRAVGLVVHRAANVMPTLDAMQVEEAQEMIRTVFMDHIVRAKGMDQLADQLHHPLMPTPSAVLRGVELLGSGSMAVDIGGATTDVYSMDKGLPQEENLHPRGLRTPVLRRTVEGDLGLRESADSVRAQAEDQLLQFLRDRWPELTPTQLQDDCQRLGVERGHLPTDAYGQALEHALAWVCVELATRRHAGRRELRHGPEGPLKLLYGKDLRGIERWVGTGGVFVGSSTDATWRDILKAGLYTKDESLRPVAPRCMADSGYQVFAAGLLSVWVGERARQVLASLHRLT